MTNSNETNQPSVSELSELDLDNVEGGSSTKPISRTKDSAVELTENSKSGAKEKGDAFFEAWPSKIS